MTDSRTLGGPPGIDRRQVLLGVGAVGVAGVLAACGGDEPADETGGEPGAGDDEAGEDDGAVEPTDDSDDSGDAGSAEEPGSGGSEALVATADVPVGSGVILEAEEVVVTQPADGEFRAFSSICTHEGCPISNIQDGLIVCVCHGSRFHIDDGSVENGPASSPLPEVAIVVEGDEIVRS